jgi:hypothetical protein
LLAAVGLQGAPKGETGDQPLSNSSSLPEEEVLH